MYFMPCSNSDHFTIPTRLPPPHINIIYLSGLNTKPDFTYDYSGILVSMDVLMVLVQNNFLVNIIPPGCFAISEAIFGLIFLLESFCLSSVWLWLMSCWEGSQCPPQSQTVWLKLKWSMRGQRRLKTGTKLIIVKFSLYQSILSVCSISIINALSAYWAEQRRWLNYIKYIYNTWNQDFIY